MTPGAQGWSFATSRMDPSNVVARTGTGARVDTAGCETLAIGGSNA